MTAFKGYQYIIEVDGEPVNKFTTPILLDHRGEKKHLMRWQEENLVHGSGVKIYRNPYYPNPYTKNQVRK